MDLRVKRLLVVVTAIIEIISVILLCYFHFPIIVVIITAIVFSVCLVLLIRSINKVQGFKHLSVARKVAYICCSATLFGSLFMLIFHSEDGLLMPVLIISSSLLSLLGLSLSK